MARVTVDDCMKHIPNRFQMTLAATVRARQITMGSTPMVEVGPRQADRAGAARDGRRQVWPGNSQPRAGLTPSEMPMR